MTYRPVHLLLLWHRVVHGEQVQSYWDNHTRGGNSPVQFNPIFRHPQNGHTCRRGGGGHYLASRYHPLSRIHACFMRGRSDVIKASTSTPAVSARLLQPICRIAHIFQPNSWMRRWSFWGCHCTATCLSKTLHVSAKIHWFRHNSLGGGLGIARHRTVNHQYSQVFYLGGHRRNHRFRPMYLECSRWADPRRHPRTINWYKLLQGYRT